MSDDAIKLDKIKLDGYSINYDGLDYGLENDDNIIFTDMPYNPEDQIDLNLDSLSRNGFWKYEEDKTMKEVREYLSATYKSHYTSQDSKTQTLDLIEGIGDADPFCRSNAIKYLSRFGKKNGKSKQDIFEGNSLLCPSLSLCWTS